MDLSRFSIQDTLRGNADIGSTYLSVFYEKLLAGLFEENENLLVRTDIQKDRDRIFMFPVFQWLTQPNKANGNFRALYVVDSEEKLRQAAAAAAGLGAGLEGQIGVVTLEAGAEVPPGTEGAGLVIASMQTLFELASRTGPGAGIAPRHFGFVVIDAAEKIAELPDEQLRAVQGHLLPSWERKTLVVEGKSTPRAKAFAWDIADNPKEVRLQESIGLVGTIKTVSYEIKEEEKLRFVLGLAADPSIRHICLFCNLKSTAIELYKRLEMNGVPTDYIAGALQPARKRQILEKALSDVAESPENKDTMPDGAGEAVAAPEIAETGDSDAVEAAVVTPAATVTPPAFVLVLTDDGAKDLEKVGFPVVVNFDIPLEPEFYAERLGFLDQRNAEACLYNLACERYMYGIPAIKRSLDPRLTLVPFAGLATLPKDASEGVPIRRESPWDDDRRGGDRRSGGRHQDGRPDDRDRDGGARRSGGRRGEARDRHDIRDRSQPRNQPSYAARRQKTYDRPPQAAHADKPAGRRPSEDAPVDLTPSGGADLYSMSMEERMALYRKKYGANLPRQNHAPETPPSPSEATSSELSADRSSGADSLSGATDPAQNQGTGKQENEKGRSFLDKLHGLWGNQRE